MARKRKVTKTKPAKKPLLPQTWIYIILVALAAGLYLNTLGHDYVLDDAIVITENVYTKKGIAGLQDIFSHDTFHGFFQEEGKDQLVSGGRYRPLSQAFFAILYSFFGLNPLAGHFTNILLYTLLVCSLFFIIRHFALVNLPARESQTFALIASLLYAVHPVHTEVVANIKGLDEILVLFFGIWSLYFAHLFIEKKNLMMGSYSGGLFFLALLSKENGVAFFAVIPFTLYLFTKSPIREILKASLFTLLALGAYLVIRHQVVGFGLHDVVPMELMNNPFLKFENGQYVQMPSADKYPLVIYGLYKYIQLLFFPYPLTHDYYPRVFPEVQWHSPIVWISACMIILLLLIGIVYLRKWRVYCYSILFFFGTIFLTSNILFPIGTHLSERFLFTPSVAFALVGSATLIGLSKKINFRFAVVLGGILILMFAITTIDRNAIWKDNYTLFTTDVKTSFGSAKVQNAAGGAIINYAQTMKDTAMRNKEIGEAIFHLQQAISIHPLYKNAYLLMGNAHYYLQKYQQAIDYFDKALGLDPLYEEALYNRGIAYRDLGRYYGEALGNLPTALDYLKKAYDYLQDDYETIRLLGVAYGNLGQPDKSIDFFKRALSLKPDDGWTHYNLGMAYLALRDSVNANLYISKAKTLNPDIGK